MAKKKTDQPKQVKHRPGDDRRSSLPKVRAQIEQETDHLRRLARGVGTAERVISPGSDLTL